MGPGYEREIMTTGRALAAKPRSASQISPGRWSIENIQNVRLDEKIHWGLAGILRRQVTTVPLAREVELKRAVGLENS